MRTVLLVAALLMAVLLGYFGRLYLEASQELHVSERALLVQRQVRRLAQLATVEGHYGQTFNHKVAGYEFFPGFSKSVMIEADARVVMGFDLEGVTVEADEQRRELVVRNWPKPKELAFELDTRYFDLDQGLFNTFNERELNAVQSRLREELRKEVDYTYLERESYVQARDLLGLLALGMQGSDWRLRVEDWPEEVPLHWE